MRKQSVYFIKPVGMDGPIKIGCSVAPNKRRETLAVWSPFPLEIVAEIQGPYTLERRFHAKHMAAHQRGEWFEATDSLKADIAAIAAGTFNIDTLPEPKCIPTRQRNKGRKWSEKQKRETRQRNAMRKIKRTQNLHFIGPYTNEAIERFIANPEKHGVSEAVAMAHYRKTSALHYRRQADAYLEKAARIEAPA